MLGLKEVNRILQVSNISNISNSGIKAMKNILLDRARSITPQHFFADVLCGVLPNIPGKDFLKNTFFPNPFLQPPNAEEITGLWNALQGGGDNTGGLSPRSRLASFPPELLAPNPGAAVMRGQPLQQSEGERGWTMPAPYPAQP